MWLKRKLFKFFTGFDNFVRRFLTGFSFILLFPIFIYILFYLVSFDFYKVVAGCIVLWIMIHINKSL